MYDNYDAYVWHEQQQERDLYKMPLCCMCGEHIQQEDAVRISGEWICDECIEKARENIYVDD